MMHELLRYGEEDESAKVEICAHNYYPTEQIR